MILSFTQQSLLGTLCKSVGWVAIRVHSGAWHDAKALENCGLATRGDATVYALLASNDGQQDSCVFWTATEKGKLRHARDFSESPKVQP